MKKFVDASLPKRPVGRPRKVVQNTVIEAQKVKEERKTRVEEVVSEGSKSDLSEEKAGDQNFSKYIVNKETKNAYQSILDSEINLLMNSKRSSSVTLPM
jgi:hypothetical protein